MAILEHEIAADDAQIRHAVGNVLRNVVIAHEQKLEVEVAAGGEEPLPVAVEFESNVVEQIGAALAEPAFLLEGEFEISLQSSVFSLQSTVVGGDHPTSAFGARVTTFGVRTFLQLYASIRIFLTRQ
jgi:hypothetical protein